MPQSHATQAPSTPWSLEVVRGRDVGKVFDLRGNEIVLGNGLGGAVGVDLSDQEANSPRRMAARQAVLESRGVDLIVRDLDSPGGTFVNRQRLLSGQARPLQPGDEIQLGGVLLRVGVSRRLPIESPASPPPLAARPRPAAPATSGGPDRLPEPFTIDGDIACRIWDDFLVVAAQRWKDLRGELASGRLADYLQRIRRPDLLPRPAAAESSDEPLDEWLGRLPVSRSSAPELDVHPDRLEIRSTGGTTRHVLRITNVGYRLLRSTARVEPASTRWLRIASPYAGRAFPTIEGTELPIEVEVPEGQRGGLSAEIVVESNGGTRRIGVSIGTPATPSALLDSSDVSSAPTISDLFRPVARTLTRLPAPARIVIGIVTALAVRSLVLAASPIPIGPRGLPMAGPRLPALAALCAAIGAVAGLVKGWRNSKSPGDSATAGIAAGFLGIMAAALIYAAVRTIEGSLGDWSSSFWAVGLVWAAIGAATAAATCLILPFRGTPGEMSR
jgi:hypothetical protein